MTDWVLVSGAGPVGLLTALRLARAAIPVTVLEAEPAIAPSTRALVYHPPTVKVLDELGLMDDARAVGLIKDDYQFRELATGTITPMNSGVLEGLTPYPYNLHLGQDALAEIILRHLSRVPGAEVRWNHRVSAVAQDEDGVVVTAETPSGTEEFQASWLIGADGARSGVRRALGLDFAGHTWPDRFMATNVHYDFEKHGFARANFIVDPVHWAIVVKINNQGLWRVTYGEDAEISEEEAIRRVPEHYKAIFPGSESYEIAAAAPYRVHERTVASYRIGRVLLAGDAAHVCNPTGGYGLTGGLLDASDIGEALADVIHGRADDSLLDRCVAERGRVYREVTTPGASENKRRLAEADPVRKAKDREHLRRIREEPDYQRAVLSYSLKLAGNDWRRAG
jgi:2-polyprenyl-6-methoxyphenol hydroxylase-like FAD-dependent oxidoreductase